MVVTLKLPAAGFWRMTPRYLSALWARHNEEQRAVQQAADYRAAVIASVLANVNRDPKQRAEPYHVWEMGFASLASLKEEHERTVTEQQASERLVQIAAMWAGVTGQPLVRTEAAG